MWWRPWLILAAGQSLVIHFGYGSPADVAIADGVISMVIFGLLGLAVWFPVRFLLKEDNQVYTTVVNVLLTGSLTILAWLFGTKFLVRTLVTEKVDYDIFWHSVLVFRATAGVLIFFVMLLVYYLFLSASRLAEKVARQAQLEAQVREGELKMLRSQNNILTSAQFQPTQSARHTGQIR